MSVGQPQPQPAVPPWPSLYNLGLEILHIDHQDPVQEGAHYLYNSYDVFRFTLYWNLIFYTPLFVLSGTYAFINLAFPPSLSNPSSLQSSIPLMPLSNRPPSATPHPRAKPNERRSRLTFAILVLLGFLTLSVGGAVLGSAIVGYVLAGLFKAARYNMSTWIPFLWAVIQVLIGLMGVWPSIIDII